MGWQKGEGQLVRGTGLVTNPQCSGPKNTYMNEVHSPLRWYQMNEHCKVWTHLCHSLLAVSSPTLRQFVSWAQGPASTTAENKRKKQQVRNQRRTGWKGLLTALIMANSCFMSSTVLWCLQVKWFGHNGTSTLTVSLLTHLSHSLPSSLTHPTLTSHTPYPHLSHTPPSPLTHPTLTSHTPYPRLSHIPPSPLTHPTLTSHTTHPHLSHLLHSPLFPAL